MNVNLTPYSFSTFSLNFSRRALIADMSTSLNVVRCAVACCDCSRFSAMRLRRVDIFSRVSRSPGVAPLPPRGGEIVGADGRAAGAGRSPPPGTASTSGLDTAPPRPVPATAAMSIPRSSATRRAAGEDFVLPLCPAVAGGGGGDALRAAVGVETGRGVAALTAGAAALVAPAGDGTAVSYNSHSNSSPLTTNSLFIASFVMTPRLLADHSIY